MNSAIEDHSAKNLKSGLKQKYMKHDKPEPIISCKWKTNIWIFYLVAIEIHHVCCFQHKKSCLLNLNSWVRNVWLNHTLSSQWLAKCLPWQSLKNMNVNYLLNPWEWVYLSFFKFLQLYPIKISNILSERHWLHYRMIMSAFIIISLWKTWCTLQTQVLMLLLFPLWLLMHCNLFKSNDRILFKLEVMYSLASKQNYLQEKNFRIISLHLLRTA